MDWSDYDVAGTGADELKRSKITTVGRVVEESVLSNSTIGLTVLSAVAVLAGILYRNTGRLSLL